MLRILLYAILFYFLYNLIFRFIIPVYRTSKQMKRKFREMHEQMQGQSQSQQQQQGFQSTPPKASATPKPKGDYIDFEEVSYR